MDTHISSYPDLEPDPAGISAARLPGEAHEVSASSADLDVGERLPSSAPKPARRRRGVLLAGVAIVAVLAAGGAFLVSPYNTVYPLPHLQASVNRATSNATHYAESALRPVLAPSASLAKVAVPTVPPPVRDAYTPKPRDQEVAELLSLHPGLSSHGDAGARLAVSTGRPAQEPADRPTAAAVPPAAVTAAVSDPPNDYVAREPGSIHGSAPAAPPVPAPVASPAAPMPKDATALVIASLPQARPATPRCAAGATRKSCAHARCCAPGCRCRGGRSSASAFPADTSARGPYRRSEPASWSDVATRAGPGSQPGH